MVCERCKKVLKEELSASGIVVNHIELGRILAEFEESQMDLLEEIVVRNGFELNKSPEDAAIEHLKKLMIKVLNELPLKLDNALSGYLSSAMNREYSGLSKLFSKKEGCTVEKYFIGLKIEKAKELIQQGQHSFSEIAYLLDYKTLNHLSNQFRQAEGVTMSEYKQNRNWLRKPLDGII